MAERAPDESFRPEWLVVALTAMLPRRRRGRIEIRTEAAVVNLDRGRVSVGAVEDPDAIVEGAAEAVLGVAAGKVPLSRLSIRGDRDLAAALLRGA